MAQPLNIGMLHCDGRDMSIAAQPLCELTEPQKMDNRHLTVRARKKMAIVSSFLQRLYNHWHIAAVTANGWCPICQSQGSRRPVVAKSAGSRTSFTLKDVLH
jgi:hypothetical protein